ncbi:MAG: hypothetical protein A2015_02630 [Spirochaetes bacterium GWF1_31_7]|nr:MAG: hypothetical protein A2Y30_10140 [Spirochaetes bacterium GWE1_32_154]OHD52170.1 MAG: hypothetical protein A2Y29_17010 [Spirochaetes bacterium GWE2_31_10]OHD53160.1 MAG: hypothetical protein A2015_02630 [Spirochaetes bacterium GWF1_31_7]OHD77155.1 MAG: hypothetical protein A2355_02615 [Spirochaetes bacterium RIFOXYB1_FULL_32_8]HBD94217.1 hypothetical protein [Spirochaetia bacterium]
MSCNCAEIDAIIQNVPINSIIRSFSQSVNNELYIHLTTTTGNATLYISIIDGETGFFIVPLNYSKKMIDAKLKLSSMLNSKLKGGRIIDISQPEGSRIVIIGIQLFDTYYRLIARLWGTGSNILITDSDYTIIELLKRYPNRGEWPNEKFTIPEKKNDKQFQIRKELIHDCVNDDLFYHYRNIRDNRQFSIKFSQLEKIINDELTTLNNCIANTIANINSDSLLIYKKYGDLINGEIYKVSKGMESILVYDYETDKKIIIPLDPLLTPQENALKYYDKYKKIKAGIHIWDVQLGQYQEKLSQFESFQEKLTASKTFDDLIKLETLLSKKVSTQKQSNTVSKKLPGRKVLLSDGFIAYISRSSREADELLKITAKGNDYWFHIRDNNGSHVVVKNRQTIEITDKVKLEAAMLALHYSKSKDELSGDIYFTRVKYLHKPNNNTPGLVFPTQEKNIKVKKDQKTLQNLLKTIE